MVEQREILERESLRRKLLCETEVNRELEEDVEQEEGEGRARETMSRESTAVMTKLGFGVCV
jgi:hypothetical protein